MTAQGRQWVRLFRRWSAAFRRESWRPRVSWAMAPYPNLRDLDLCRTDVAATGTAPPVGIDGTFWLLGFPLGLTGATAVVVDALAIDVLQVDAPCMFL